MAKAPFGPPEIVLPGKVGNLTVAGRSAFFTMDDGVYWLGDGRARPKRIATEPGARDLVADGRFLYWLRNDSGQIVRLQRPD